MPTLDRTDDVFLLRLDADENRFNPTWLAAVNALLDEVDAAPGPKALVTVGQGKFWSNGLDLEWMATAPEQAGEFVATVHALLARILVAPYRTVAALNGHTFAAGAMLAIAHDTAVMRADRGFLCLPEVDIHIPFTPGMAALIQSRLSKAAAHEAMTTGRRYGGADAAAAGIVAAAVPDEEVLPAALERAKAYAHTAGDTLGAIKLGMYGPAVETLRTPAAVALPTG